MIESVWIPPKKNSKPTPEDKLYFKLVIRSFSQRKKERISFNFFWLFAFLFDELMFRVVCLQASQGQNWLADFLHKYVDWDCFIEKAKILEFGRPWCMNNWFWETTTTKKNYLKTTKHFMCKYIREFTMYYNYKKSFYFYLNFFSIFFFKKTERNGKQVRYRKPEEVLIMD